MDAITENCQKEIETILNRLCNRVLLVAEASLPSQQYEAFKKIVLKEFGQYGAKKQVEEALKAYLG